MLSAAEVQKLSAPLCLGARAPIQRRVRSDLVIIQSITLAHRRRLWTRIALWLILGM